jgi:hypothetical protein
LIVAKKAVSTGDAAQRDSRVFFRVHRAFLPEWHLPGFWKIREGFEGKMAAPRNGVLLALRTIPAGLNPAWPYFLAG